MTPHAIFQNQFYISDQVTAYSRQVGGIWDLAQNIAGIYELIVSAFGLILYSVS
jgi:hypothetical protein